MTQYYPKLDTDMITIEEIIKLFEEEFGFIKDKFVVIKLLSDGTSVKRQLQRDVIHEIKLDFVHHPGVYVFYANDSPYRVGRHFENTRLRVMQHIDAKTGNKDHNVMDLNKYEDREVLLFNLKDPKEAHWAAALEVFLETQLQPKGLKIPAKRQG